MYLVTKQRFFDTTHWHPRFALLPRILNVYQVRVVDPNQISNQFIPVANTTRTGKRAFVWLENYHTYCYGDLTSADSHTFCTVSGFIVHPTRMRE